MPSGKVHDFISVSLTPAVFWIGSKVFDGELNKSLLLSLSFLLSSLFLSPDLDTHSKPLRRWGKLRFIWYPYTKLVKHRSRLSHGIFLGPLTRTVWLWMWIVVLTGAFIFFKDNLILLKNTEFAEAVKQSFHHSIDFVLQNKTSFAIIFAGIWLGGAVHTISDKIHSFISK